MSYQSNQNDQDHGGASSNNPPPVAAAAAAAQTESAKALESKPRPTRPLSAYNLFFQAERKNMLNVLPVRAKGKPRHSHGKIGFADLARNIAAKWKTLTKEEREPFDTQAAAEKKRYAKELKVWKKEQEAAKQAMRREHEMLIQQRTGLSGGLGGGMGLDAAAAAAGYRNSATSGVLQLPSTATMGRNPVQVFDDFPGAMQHPYQQTDPAMLSSNTAPNVLDTSNSAWSASNQAYQHAQQNSFFAQERQRAFHQDPAFSHQSLVRPPYSGMNTMANQMDAMRSGVLGLGTGQEMNQFNLGGRTMNQPGLMGSLTGAASGGMNTMRQYSGLGDASLSGPFGLQGQGATPAWSQQDVGRRYGAAAGLGMGIDQLTAARMTALDSPGGYGSAARWHESYAAGGDFASQATAAASPLLGVQQQQQQQQQQQSPNSSRGASSSDEMERFLRNQFGP